MDFQAKLGIANAILSGNLGYFKKMVVPRAEFE